MDQTRTIVIIGGGFAGTTLARELDGRLPPGYHLLLISEESYTTFNPMLPEAVGASIFPEQVVAPIRQMLRHGRFIMGRVSAIDRAAKTLQCATLAGDITIAYEHLVLAFGNRARLDLIPGLAENALPLKTVGDAMHIRNMVLRRVAQIELEDDAQARRRLGHFVVIGGGFSGVEVAGELIDCLHSIRRYYPRVRAEEVKVTVLQDQPRLLLELSERLGLAAQRSLAARGVDVRTGARATAVDRNSVTLADGQVLQAATVICTIGTRPNALVESLGVPTERGRVVVNGDLSIRGAPGLWAIGDCALVPNAYDNKLAPPTAQFAVREARCLAGNLLAVLSEKPTQAFNYRARGQMAAIGHLKGVADIFGVPLWGLPAWLLWRAYYLLQMPTLGRKVRIFVEWTWGMFFPTDITHLRFTRSTELESAAPPAITPGRPNGMQRTAVPLSPTLSP
ncbi:MAG TPA: NAD(P)/FAD-dependent oxidoreductase [Burkholderiaceae bacterium]|nr:NAD(P)/FAD-dependent oxidoreductase [Burkholderiaceae bacterium]